MKTLALLVVLATLISCGKSGGGSNGGPVRQRYQDAFSTLARGQTSNSKNIGQVRSFDWDAETATTAPLNEEEFKVVLKIEGNKVYSYEVTTDKTDGSVDMKVSADSYKPSDMDAILALPGTAMSGDMLYFSDKFESDWELRSAKVNETYSMMAVVNLGKPLCDISISMTTSGIMIKNGITTVLPVLTSKDVETCGRIMTSAELRAIDLTSIDFCEEVADNERECESDRDMSYLTADL